MKALRLTLAVAFLAFTVLASAGDATKARSGAKQNHKKSLAGSKSADIQLSNATKNHVLVRQMYLQIDQDAVLSDPAVECIKVSIGFNGNRIKVEGSYAEWVLFFLMDNLPPDSDELHR